MDYGRLEPSSRLADWYNHHHGAYVSGFYFGLRDDGHAEISAKPECAVHSHKPAVGDVVGHSKRAVSAVLTDRMARERS